MSSCPGWATAEWRPPLCSLTQCGDNIGAIARTSKSFASEKLRTYSPLFGFERGRASLQWMMPLWQNEVCIPNVWCLELTQNMQKVKVSKKFPGNFMICFNNTVSLYEIRMLVHKDHDMNIMNNLELNYQWYLKLSINYDLYEQACQCKFFLLVRFSVNILWHLYFPRTHDSQNMKIVRCNLERPHLYPPPLPSGIHFINNKFELWKLERFV